MATQPRAWRLEYGLEVIGDAATLVDGPPIIEFDADQGHVEISFIQAPAASDAAFKAAIDALRAELQKPRQRLRIIQSVDGPDVVLIDLDPGTASAFHQAPRLSAPGDEAADTDSTTRWVFRCDFLLPSDKYGNAGRRDSTVRLSFTPAKVRAITVTGEYRADTSDTSARSQYRAAIASYVSAIVTAIGGGVFERISRDEVVDDIDKVATFEEVHQEVTIDQSTGVFNHPTLFDQELVTARIIEAPGDAPGDAQRLQILEVTYSVSVDREVTTDLIGTYESISRPWLLTYVARVYGAAAIAVTKERPEFDGQRNVIRAQLEIMLDPGSELLRFRVTTRVADDFGTRLIGTYTRRRLQKYRFQGHGTLTRTVMEMRRFRGTAVAECTPTGVQIPGPGSEAQRSRSRAPEKAARPASRDEKSGGEQKKGPPPGTEGGAGGAFRTALMMTIVDAETSRLGTEDEGFDVSDVTSTTIEECYEELPTPQVGFREFTRGGVPRGEAARAFLEDVPDDEPRE